MRQCKNKFLFLFQIIKFLVTGHPTEQQLMPILYSQQIHSLTRPNLAMALTDEQRQKIEMDLYNHQKLQQLHSAQQKQLSSSGHHQPVLHIVDTSHPQGQQIVPLITLRIHHNDNQRHPSNPNPSQPSSYKTLLPAEIKGNSSGINLVHREEQEQNQQHFLQTHPSVKIFCLIEIKILQWPLISKSQYRLHQ